MRWIFVLIFLINSIRCFGTSLSDPINPYAFDHPFFEEKLIQIIQQKRKKARRNALEKNLLLDQTAHEIFYGPYRKLLRSRKKRLVLHKMIKKYIHGKNLNIRYHSTSFLELNILPNKFISQRRLYNETLPGGPYFVKNYGLLNLKNDTSDRYTSVTPLTYQELLTKCASYLFKGVSKKRMLERYMSNIAISSHVVNLNLITRHNPKIQIMILISGRLSTYYELKHKHKN